MATILQLILKFSVLLYSQERDARFKHRIYLCICIYIFSVQRPQQHTNKHPAARSAASDAQQGSPLSGRGRSEREAARCKLFTESQNSRGWKGPLWVI